MGMGKSRVLVRWGLVGCCFVEVCLWGLMLGVCYLRSFVLACWIRLGSWGLGMVMDMGMDIVMVRRCWGRVYMLRGWLEGLLL